ncbi:DUF4124 domain-containing protein [Pseudoalteromonas sp. T1lg23B]|uniref:DUF4124 domain-containing protein n=1 Tax=Pseudoalteromonas sp. T1lg23B TaxID=2077097 RepID=UPI000CF68D69|nr:DUF4124 domain-containing protein [Pseudoalteromonas sp. T1lg23B]
MKYFSYMLVMIMLIGLGSLFVLKRPDGKPWLSLSSITQKTKESTSNVFDDAKSTLNNSLKHIASSSTKTPSGSIYKWQDANGNWVYSDQPNPNGHSQTHVLDTSKVTIMAAEDTAILKDLAAQKAQIEAKLKVPSALNPSDVKQLMLDAQNIQKLMDERTKKIDQAIEGQ